MAKNTDLETGSSFDPQFDAAGLIVASVSHAGTGAPLMTAWMNRAAIDHTLASGKITFWSRSRRALWTKGETSGRWLDLVEMRVDCDQDSLWITAIPHGPTCHTGAAGCFYRRVTTTGLEHAE